MAAPKALANAETVVGRQVLLEWINDLLMLDYNKVEDAGNGAAFCQVMDALYPGTVGLARVNYDAINEAERVENYKILQEAFERNGVQQYLDVQSLKKGKYMATLELFQWIYAYYNACGGSQGYDAKRRRQALRVREPSQRGRLQIKPAGMAPKRKIGAVVKDAAADDPAPARPAPARRAIPSKRPPPEVADEGAGEHPKRVDFQRRVEQLEEELEGMVQQRDFYYNRLREIEEWATGQEGSEAAQEVLAILYRTDEAGGFVTPDGDEG